MTIWGLVWGLLSSLIACTFFCQIRAGVLSRCIFYTCTDIVPCQVYLLLLCTGSKLRELCSRMQHECSSFLRINIKLAQCCCRLAEPQEHWHCSLHGQCGVEDPLLPSVASHQAGKLTTLLQMYTMSMLLLEMGLKHNLLCIHLCS